MRIWKKYKASILFSHISMGASWGLQGVENLDQEKRFK